MKFIQKKLKFMIKKFTKDFQLIIYSIFEDMKTNIFIKSFVNANSKKFKRTIITYLELSTKFNFNRINSKKILF